MVLVASLYELSRPSSPSGLLHGCGYCEPATVSYGRLGTTGYFYQRDQHQYYNII